jgi:hypothetical protein
MRRAYGFLACPLFGAAVAMMGPGCGTSSGSGFADAGTSGSSGGSSGSASGSSGGSSGFGSSSGGSSGSFGDAAPPDNDGGNNDCAPGAGQYIYVISDMNNLYTFDPTKFPSASAFTLVGAVPCVPSGSYVNSMAIDRQATAYINFHDGSIVKMNTTAPLACTPTSFMPNQLGFTNDLGMGFSTDAAGSKNETLYVSDNGGPEGDCMQTTPGPGCMGLGLAKMDLSSWTLTKLGAYTSTAAGYNAELTGTGDAKLYGFFTTAPSSYGPIDKTSGHTDSPAPTVISSVSVGSGGYAFSFWGGDFYFYIAPTMNTVPQHLNTKTGTVTPGDMLSFVVVGAGVSTCAPFVPPQ